MKFTFLNLHNAIMKIVEEMQRKQAVNDLTEEESRALLTKMLILGIKQYSAPDKDEYEYESKDQIQSRFDEIEITKMMMCNYTPQEFINMFPIKKDFSGQKFGWKDYYSTIEYIKTLPPDEKIGKNIDEFLWEYQNDDIGGFMVESMGRLSDLMEATTGESLGSKLIDEMGIPTMTMHDGTNGQKYMIDENGRSKPVNEKKKRPKYLKVVK